MRDIGSPSARVPDDPARRTVWHEDSEYLRRDGALYSTFLGLGEWGNALEQQREAWIGTPVESLFPRPKKRRHRLVHLGLARKRRITR